MTRHRIAGPTPLIWILLSLAAVMLIASAVLLLRYGASGFYAATGRPWSLHSRTGSSAVAPPLPQFTTTQKIAAAHLTPGASQVITVTARSSQAQRDVIKAWVTSPALKQVWRSPDDALTNFPAGQDVATNYSFVLPPGSKLGVYKVSFIIESPDEHTDYVVKENFAEFTVP